MARVIRKASGIVEIENSLRIISGNADRLTQLVNQLLDFRQTELKRFSLSMERTDITYVLSNAYNDFKALAEQSNIKIDFKVPQAPVIAYVDVDAFKKIIYNLFSNAVKYTSTVVEVSLLLPAPVSNEFVIQFKNDGALIPIRLKEKIFEPFFRVKETSHKTGTGIGLALSRSLAEMHGGTLTLHTQEEALNVFLLTLPIGTNENHHSAR